MTCALAFHPHPQTHSQDLFKFWALSSVSENPRSTLYLLAWAFGGCRCGLPLCGFWWIACVLSSCWHVALPFVHSSVLSSCCSVVISLSLLFALCLDCVCFLVSFFIVFSQCSCRPVSCRSVRVYRSLLHCVFLSTLLCGCLSSRWAVFDLCFWCSSLLFV